MALTSQEMLTPVGSAFRKVCTSKLKNQDYHGGWRNSDTPLDPAMTLFLRGMRKLKCNSVLPVCKCLCACVPVFVLITLYLVITRWCRWNVARWNHQDPGTQGGLPGHVKTKSRSLPMQLLISTAHKNSFEYFFHWKTIKLFFNLSLIWMLCLPKVWKTLFRPFSTKTLKSAFR